MKIQNKVSIKKLNRWEKIVKDFKRNKYKYLIVLPVIIYFIIFSYKPMYGVIIAFKRYRLSLGIMNSPWVGIDNFVNFFNDFYFIRIVRNTFLISLYSLLWGFPVPIIFALFLNELHNTKLKRIVQTTSYLPHFISIVIICSMITQFSLSDGLFNDIIVFFGGERSSLLQSADNFRTIFVSSGIWQQFGWSSIIYIAALTSIDQEMYEAAKIDGAGRLKQAINITLPCIMPTIAILLILKMGGLLSVGYEKVLLLYNTNTYETADVISTYIYRKGLLDADFSYSTAVGLFNSAINLVFLMTTNYISKKAAGIGLY